MELATKKRDRENKENKEKILSNTRREIERKNEYQVSYFFSFLVFRTSVISETYVEAVVLHPCSRVWLKCLNIKSLFWLFDVFS